MAWTFPSVSAEESQLKRATMDWTWPGEPATAPLDADSSLTLIDDGEDLPVRPMLKHTATAPLGQIGDFIHNGPTYADNQHPPVARASLRSLIDLSLDLSDASDPQRPSTAVSHAGSTSTTMTTGPFDLEDSSDVRDADQNRVSLHKQWLSEGADEGRNSLRKLPLHQRGSSLSSTDSDTVSHNRREFYNDEYLSDYEFENYFDKMAGPMVDPTARSESGSTWDMVEDDEIEYSTPATPHIGDFTFPLATTLPNVDVAGIPRPPRRQGSDPKTMEALDFPTPQPPNSEALFDRADDQVVMTELRRLLRDAGDAFKSTAVALQRYSELENKEQSQVNNKSSANHVGPSGQYTNGA